MTIIKFKNFKFYVNGKAVSDEYGLYRFGRKKAAMIRLNTMRKAKAISKYAAR
jgi:hypothetical protein